MAKCAPTCLNIIEKMTIEPPQLLIVVVIGQKRAIESSMACVRITGGVCRIDGCLGKGSSSPHEYFRDPEAVW